jgi:hypothetical protein
VNPDASLCFAVRGSAWSARHGCGDHVCCVDNAERRRRARALSGAARLCAAPSLTVDVAAIAAGADQHLDAASCAQIEARGRFRLLGVSTDAWTNRAMGEILPRHACSRTVWGAAPMRTASCESAPCLSSRKTDV